MRPHDLPGCLQIVGTVFLAGAIVAALAGLVVLAGRVFGVEVPWPYAVAGVILSTPFVVPRS